MTAPPPAPKVTALKLPALKDVNPADRAQFGRLSQTYAGRLLLIAAQLGLSGRGLAERCGLSHATLNHAIRGETDGLQRRNEDALVNSTGVAIQWLRFGTGDWKLGEPNHPPPPSDRRARDTRAMQDRGRTSPAPAAVSQPRLRPAKKVDE